MNWKSQSGVEKHLYIRPRSIIIASGEARYAWFHSISPRKIDKVEGDFEFRRRRVSLTFRRSKPEPCTCNFKFFCNS